MEERKERMWIPQPEFEHLFYIEVACRPRYDVGPVAEGDLRMQPIKGGYFEGERLRGTVMDDGCDWNTLRNDGVMECNTRYTLKTDDGAYIALDTVANLIKDPEQVAKMLTHPLEKGTRFYYREHLHFHTGDPRYSWLNGAVAFGICEVIDMNTICYDAYILK